MMKQVVSMLLCALLALSLGAAALAESYPGDQSFAEDRSGVAVYTVQLAATELQSGAVQLRSSVLALGYDCFLYSRDGLYYVMCGKFSDRAEAENYCALILSSTGRSSGYVTTAYLPEAEVETFARIYAESAGSGPEAGAPRYQPVSLALKPNTFAPNQLYYSGDGEFTVYTVQVSAHGGHETAGLDRDRMLEAGYDSFVYDDGSMSYVMCGKFTSAYEAFCYSESIHTDPARYSAFVTFASLPAAAIQTFADRLSEFMKIPQTPERVETYWERPTGAYFRSDIAGSVEVYTVQLGQGSSFTGIERKRDALTEKGYPAFCYKVDMAYKAMSGMFTDKAEAERYCQELNTTGGQSGAVVRTALVPQGELESFQSWYESR